MPVDVGAAKGALRQAEEIPQMLRVRAITAVFYKKKGQHHVSWLMQKVGSEINHNAVVSTISPTW